MIVVSGHSLHETMLQIENDLFLVSVVLDKAVQSVRMRHPSNQTRVGRQRYYGKPLNSQVTSQRLKEKKTRIFSRRSKKLFFKNSFDKR